ncbi:helix-turn-helix domain containing protein [Bacillus cereus]|uniref:helix-turn-helix domain containing protein n=1 Tax=Bacillus cereus TaxID=1396 RepID=UPI002D7A3EE0|nr:helix-turn-helix domain containing protein [Bacillus cereus]
MEKFLTELIQDKSALRKLKILEILMERNEITSSTKLAQKLHCTSRTIISDISELKLILPKSCDLVSIKSKGYLLKQNALDEFSYIVCHFLLNSELYQILKSIFNYKYYTLEKWSQLLYVNKLTLNKILRKFDEILSHFELKFSTCKIKLVGNELNIRYFFITFFYNIQNHKIIFNLNSCLQKKLNTLLGDLISK